VEASHFKGFGQKILLRVPPVKLLTNFLEEIHTEFDKYRGYTQSEITLYALRKLQDFEINF
jgi:hypothetical protein